MGRRRHDARTGRVLGWTSRGEGRVDTGGEVVSVPGVVPGDRVRVGRVRKRGGRLHGRLDAVLEPSEDRVDPPCAVQARCGGCPLMVATPSLQAEHKVGLVRRALQRAGGPPVDVAWVPARAELGYRRRARLHFLCDRGNRRIGYRSFRSHAVVDVERCPVLLPELNGGLASLRQGWLPHLAGRGEIHLGLGAGERPVAWLRSDAPQPSQAYDAVRRSVEQGAFAGVALRAGGATADAVFGEPAEHTTALDGLPLVGPVGGFAQAQEAANHELVSQVAQWASPRGARVLELFAGHGNLTVALVAAGGEVTAVERDPEGARACEANLGRRGLAAKVRQADAASAAAGPPVDVVVLDPPREGAREALAAIADRRPERIVYVSCEPATLGRDLAVLAEHGYGATDAAAFDMFPHTAHVEAVVRLELLAGPRGGR